MSHPLLLSRASPAQAELPPTLNSFESFGLFLLIRHLIVPGLASFIQLFLWARYFPSSHEFLKLGQTEYRLCIHCNISYSAKGGFKVLKWNLIEPGDRSPQQL